MNKFKVMSFSGYPYSNFLLVLFRRLINRVTPIKELGIFFSPTLSFEFHLNNIIGRALKVVGYIKLNTTNLSSITSLRGLYYSLVRSILDYVMMIWNSIFT